MDWKQVALSAAGVAGALYFVVWDGSTEKPTGSTQTAATGKKGDEQSPSSGQPGMLRSKTCQPGEIPQYEYGPTGAKYVVDCKPPEQVVAEKKERESPWKQCPPKTEPTGRPVCSMIGDPRTVIARSGATCPQGYEQALECKDCTGYTVWPGGHPPYDCAPVLSVRAAPAKKGSGEEKCPVGQCVRDAKGECVADAKGYYNCQLGWGERLPDRTGAGDRVFHLAYPFRCTAPLINDGRDPQGYAQCRMTSALVTASYGDEGTDPMSNIRWFKYKPAAAGPPPPPGPSIRGEMCPTGRCERAADGTCKIYPDRRVKCLLDEGQQLYRFQNRNWSVINPAGMYCKQPFADGRAMGESPDAQNRTNCYLPPKVTPTMDSTQRWFGWPVSG